MFFSICNSAMILTHFSLVISIACGWKSYMTVQSQKVKAEVNAEF
ncbi:hypothetical protein [Acinetobacter bereziniae]|nr:hypothetical protein [Acinetobacter bereziniae]